MLNNIEQFWKQFNSSKSLAIIANREPWGDSLSAALAIKIIAEKLGKNASVFAWQAPSGSYSFLPHSDSLQGELRQDREFIISLATGNAKVSRVNYKLHPDRLDFIITPNDGFFTDNDISIKGGNFAYDCIITINVQDLVSLGDIYQDNTDFFYKTPLINIDNQAGNENFGQINLVNVNATSSSEIIFEFVKENQPNIIDDQIATCLLTGIVSRTKSFKADNITPQSLLITAELIKQGADRELVIAQLYRNRNVSTIKLWGRLLSSLESSLDDRLLHSTLEEADVNLLNDSDISQIVDELIIQIPETLVVIIFLDRGDTCSVISASPKNINGLSLLKDYHPYGSKRIAWAEIAQPVANIREQLLAMVAEKLEKIT